MCNEFSVYLDKKITTRNKYFLFKQNNTLLSRMTSDIQSQLCVLKRNVSNVMCQAAT